MAKGEIVISEAYCCGCGLCRKFCGHNCITMPGDRFNPQGYVLPAFSDPERCNGCGICGWMCPHAAIEVYKYVESSA